MQFEEEEKGDRRGTFRPPFNPDGARFSKARGEAEKFSFNRRNTGALRTLKSAENPFKGISKEHLNASGPGARAETIYEVKTMKS